MRNYIRCFIEGQDRVRTRIEYVIGILFEGIGVPHIFVANIEEADIVYAFTKPENLQNKVWIPSAKVENWEQKCPAIAWDDDIPYVGPSLKMEHTGNFKGDLIYSAYATLTGCFETQNSKDDFGVPVVSKGYMPENFLDTAVVAKYCSKLRNIIEIELNDVLNIVPLWPEGKKFAIVISHDVDAPCSFIGLNYRLKYVKSLAYKKQWLASFKAACILVMKGVGSLGRESEFYRQDPNLCFDKWVALQQQLQASSAFYIATTTSADKIGAPQDVTYNYRDPVFLAEVNKTLEAGFEIGLHGSINAWRSKNGIILEKEALQAELPNAKIEGIRNHYWSMDDVTPENTLKMHQDAGFFYDSTLGLNDAPGFRRGMVWPYIPFNPVSGFALDIIEVPPTLMDGGVFYHEVDRDEGVKKIRKHIKAIENVGGAVVLNWHLEQMNPANLRQAGPALEQALMELVHREDIYWCSPREIANHWATRKEKIMNKLTGVDKIIQTATR